MNMLFSNTQTGNPIMDYIISTLILSLLTYIYQNFKHIKKYLMILYDYIWSNNISCELIIEAQNVIYNRSGITTNKLRYSIVFQAIAYFIKILNSDEIYSKREPDKNEKDNNPIFDIFIPDQNKPFFLDKEGKIQCFIKMSEDEINNNGGKEVRKNHIIRIFSTNKNVKIYDLENFVDSCVMTYNKYLDDKTINDQYYFCFNNSEENGEHLNFTKSIFRTNRTFNTVFFENKDKYIKNLDFFLHNPDWYSRKGIPYHYGILLHGHPGCGKTSIIKATLEHTKRHAFVIPLNRVKTCGELNNIFFKSDVNHMNIPIEKRIYIFEDIDCICDIIKDRDIVHDKELSSIKIEKKKYDLNHLLFNLKDKDKDKTKHDDELNLSFLLNIFDGILETPGRIIILTSNYPDKIDKALLRPGRIDINIELKKASSIIMNEILQSFYDDHVNVEFEDYQLTPAKVMNICQNNIFDRNNAIKEILES